MHEVQEKLLRAIDERGLAGKTLREIGHIVGEDSAQKVKHHLTQLSRKGFISYNPTNRDIKRTRDSSLNGLISLPVVGAADCGPATFFADENVVGYLKVSKRLAPQGQGLFVLRAEGNSMNRADIGGKTIESGDFVVVDTNQRSPKQGQYIVSVIDEVANIKRFIPDPQNNRIILKSESTQDYLPIYIHEDDKFEVSGTVVDVIKK